MGMAKDTNPRPTQLSLATRKLAILGLTNKQKRKAVTKNRHDWDKWLQMNQNGTSTEIDPERYLK